MAIFAFLCILTRPVLKTAVFLKRVLNCSCVIARHWSGSGISFPRNSGIIFVSFSGFLGHTAVQKSQPNNASPISGCISEGISSLCSIVR